MRFAQTACKFEGLHFSHRFFYDLMYLLAAMSVNLEEKEIKKDCVKNLETHHSKIKSSGSTNHIPNKCRP